MNRTTLASVALSAAGLMLVSCSSDGQKSETAQKPAAPPAAAPLTYEDSASVVTTGKVDAVDHASRRLTLRTPSGRTTTYVVGPQVQRLNEVKVGDDVTGEHTVSLQAELRPPTAEESANPIVITDISGRSPQGSDPAGTERRSVRVVTTVQAVDPARMLVTLKGPMGDTTTVRARNAENVKKLHVGDTIVINYVETAVLSLVKWYGQ